jgi:phage terminase large subunit GpA-like protein
VGKRGVIAIAKQNKIRWKRPRHEYPGMPGEYEAGLPETPPLPSVFANESLWLVPGGYGIPGKLKLKPYQIFPTDLIYEWYGSRRVIFKGPTRTAKSLMAECCIFWAMRWLAVNGIVAYAEKDTVSYVFRTKFSPMIRGLYGHNKELRNLWDGKEDNLTQDKLILKNCFWRTASAQDINDLASFGAGFVYGSEIAKWQEMADNPVLKLYGRQDDYPMELRYSIIESSPREINDYLYRECFKPGTIIVEPHYPCPVCGEYQTLRDSQIKLRQDGVEDPTRQAARLRDEKDRAVFYQCIHCEQEITEAGREAMDARVVYAAPAQVDITAKKRHEQAGEKIDRSGNVMGPRRTRYDQICVTWNRGVDLNFTFHEWLARFFESCHTPDKYLLYENETNARHFETKTDRLTEIGVLESKRGNYWMAADAKHDNFIPDEILDVTAALDSQKEHFYYVIMGWGAHRAAWVLRYGMIYCPITDPHYSDPRVIFETVTAGLIADNPLVKKSGATMSIRGALIDRGGIRPTESIDFLVRNIPGLVAYIGATRDNPTRELIYKSTEGPWYMGKTERLSERVSQLLETDMFFLPMDCGVDFMKQALAQYHETITDTHGNEKTVWHHGGEDHYRDCLNYNYAVGELLKHDLILRNSVYVEKLMAMTNRAPAPDGATAPEPASAPAREGDTRRQGVQRDYFRGPR